ncbi:phospholipase A1 PLIP2, chloroplastic isoform X2 [Ricinus communis]|uniref:phospholipase A1 PLIP2, chloroplastic isoform X2 n=1 Tax=Ricinus communis TaxID=3988 RepID=UPI00077231B1|nr:phospholipase A1 PLIP2, chloroplastic isoform X2 [Ricinus communis]|eukprot:XP_015572432.1 uncharacterized protein LOC8267364 isoform X2 [Ricinus communis]
MDSLCLKPGIHSITPSISVGGGGAALEVRANASQVSATPPQKAASRFSFRYPLQSFWPGGGKSNNNNNRYNGMAVDDAVLVENKEDSDTKSMSSLSEVQNGNNWVLKILHVRSLRKDEEERSGGEESDNNGGRDVVEMNGGVNNEEEVEEHCDACRVDDDDEKGIEFDKDSFSRLLKKVSLAEAKLYAQMSYLGNLAYCIPRIKAGNLLKYRGLHYVTSSIDKRELSMKTEKIQVSAEDQEAEAEAKKGVPEKEAEVKEQKNNGYHISASAAYQIAASAASYLHSHTKSILPFKSSKSEAGNDSPEGSNGGNKNVNSINSEVASLMATTDSVTAVVAAKEEVKQAVADDLSSTHSSPCEWFICDDDQGTRYFVIQGSESLASWQANLLFEPVQFEGLDVLVHRGIYEAAKGMYEQMLPEVRTHLKSCGRRATFRFTGHSLVMCGGDSLLRKLGLPRSHVQAIAMHRDIVPRAFSCNYPNHVAELLKAVNGSFRNHPCLNNQKLLYAPMGDFIILQPDEKFSPHHHLLPSGSGLYFLSCPLSDANDAEKLLRAAQSVFLNSPHPLEILSDRSAYGSEGTIQRDHDMNSYLKSVRSVIRQELNRIRKSKRENRRKFWWSILAPRGIAGGGVLMERPLVSNNMGQSQFNFSGVLHTGRESFKRFSRLVASQHMHLLVVLLFPARLLLLGAYSVINIR